MSDLGTSDILSVIALTVSLIALTIAFIQLLQALIATDEGFRRCSASVIRPWHNKEESNCS